MQDTDFEQIVNYYKPLLEKGNKSDAGKLPIYTVLFKQFPKAMQELVKCSQAGHIKYPDDVDWLNFKRVENKDRYLDAALRHLLEFSETNSFDKELFNLTNIKVLSLAQVIWNLSAYLERSLDESNNNE